MKKGLILVALGMTILASCKSSKGHCDAYGNKSGSVVTKKENS